MNHDLIENDLNYSDRLCVTLKVTPEYLNNYPTDIKGRIIKAISLNDITRDFNIQGECFSDDALDLIHSIILAVRAAYPHIKITIETRKEFADLIKSNNQNIREILKKINFLKTPSSLIAIDN